MNDLDTLTPEEIRSIRKRLGLTQVQAGQRLGGGPRAFAKYESGTVRPSASVVTLLRLLEANPEMLESAEGQRSPPIAPTEVGPFEVTHEHVAALDARNLPPLLHRLLKNEAHAHALPTPDIHVPRNIDARDGGEDGRIAWIGCPGRTSFLPSRTCQFQLKARTILPSAVAAEVLTRSGTIKPMVRSVLEAGGCYILLIAHPYSRESIENRETRILDALRGAGLDVQGDQVVVFDARRVADWTNCHPSVAAWLKELTQPGTLGPFRSWTDWSRRPKHLGSPFVDDDRLSPYCAFLRDRVPTPQGCARVVGLPGVGKTRLTLEALGPVDAEGTNGLSPSDLVLYADESVSGTEAVIRTVEILATGQQRAIVVVDGCPSKTHRILADLVSRTECRLSLVTLDDEIPAGTPDRETYPIPKAPSSVTDAIIDRVSPRLASEDRRRIAHFSRGFPEVALLVARAWEDERPVAHATDDDLVDTFILGSNPRDKEPLLRSAELLACFGQVAIDHPRRSALAAIAARGRNLSAADLHAHIQDLIARGVAQRRGGSVVLLPSPITMKLAERQWRAWDGAQWDDVLAGDGDSELKVLAARRLSWLNTTPLAREVAIHVCGPDGPFAGRKGLCAPGNASVLSFLAEIDHEVVAERIEHSLDDFDDHSTIRGEVQGGLVAALEKIAFHPDGFDSGARLLLRLAAARGSSYPGNARKHFKSLFPGRLGNTAADGAARLSFLAEFSDTKDESLRLPLVEALAEGTSTGMHAYRFVGPETHGSRPAMESWHPASREQFCAYITGCVKLLARFAMCGDEAGMVARRSLGDALRELVDSGLIEVVEDVVRRVGAVVVPWSEALEGLNHFLIFDANSSNRDAAQRVRALIEALTPEDPVSRVRLLVTQMPWDYLDDGSEDFAARDERQAEAVRSLAADLTEAPDVLAGVLPEISCGSQRMASLFGQTLAERHESPLDWLEAIVSAVLEAPEEERNFDLLSGFLVGLAKVDPGAVAAFKRDAARSPELAPALPLICMRLGVASEDIELAVRALGDGILPAWRLELWATGSCLDETPSRSVALLVDALVSHGLAGVDVAVIIMRMYAHGAHGRLQKFRPQLRRVAEEFTRGDHGSRHYHAVHDFTALMQWILGMGREDDDACATALTLAKAVAANENHVLEQSLKELFPLLLERFPEIVWPIVSKEIVSDDGRPWRMEYLLGERPSTDREMTPTLLSLPREYLFAWCHAHPECAPSFVARAVPVLTSYEMADSDRSLHPVALRLLDEFGDRDDVRQSLLANIQSFSWSGSPTAYFALHEAPFVKLQDEHPRPDVCRWARKTLQSLAGSGDAWRDYDAELRARWEI